MTIAAPAAGVGSVIAVATVVAARFMFRQWEGERDRGAEMREGGVGGVAAVADEIVSYGDEPYSPKGERWGEEGRRGSGGVGAGRDGVGSGDMEGTEGLAWNVVKVPRDDGENNGEMGRGGVEENGNGGAVAGGGGGGGVGDVASEEGKEEDGGNNGRSSR